MAVGPSAPPTVLLVEDHDDTREVAERILHTHGYAVHAFATAEAALEWARSTAVTFDVALIDIALPDMDGIDLLKRLRAIRSLPAVAFTARLMPDDLLKYRVARFDEVAAKPFCMDTLLATLRRMVPPPSDDDAADEVTVHS